ncbi:MAG: hypothetical protein K2W82_15540 [Candidatus Obscuribacterales bacterium]|nr:hypothetical protein [Candidatus Obscuribacterales bacterium]
MRNHSVRSISSLALMEKYPSIVAALPLASLSPARGPCDDVHIKVERADVSFLAYKPVLCSGTDGITLYDPQKVDLAGCRHELIVAVDAEHRLLGQVGVTNSVASSVRDLTEVKHLVLAHVGKLEYLLRFTVTVWRERIGLCSAAREREVLVTVFQKPKEGFVHLLGKVITAMNLHLYFDGPGVLRENEKPAFNNPEVARLIAGLHESVARFERETFAPGFLSSYRFAKTDARLGNISVSYAVTRPSVDGAIMLTLSRGDASLKLMLPDKSSRGARRLEVIKANSTFLQAYDLLADANRFWKAGEKFVVI